MCEHAKQYYSLIDVNERSEVFIRKPLNQGGSYYHWTQIIIVSCFLLFSLLLELVLFSKQSTEVGLLRDVLTELKLESKV
jgi:hypothetical protein